MKMHFEQVLEDPSEIHRSQLQLYPSVTVFYILFYNSQIGYIVPLWKQV